MNLNALLSKKKAAILKRWFDFIVNTYPADASQFLKIRKNQFTNPVGHTVSQGIEDILNGLLQETASEKLSLFLDNIIRIRAVQDFTASQAVIFIFYLKKAIREELETEIRENHLYEELLALESRIDVLSLQSFDIFMKCREKIYDLKATELRDRTIKALKRANLISEVNGEESDTKDVNKVDNSNNIKQTKEVN
ncbi:MAG: hypothetical protein C0415_02460 [Thermodesulfovibrio sp.]|nr:hypothetical protein [Thermodesulfovibrio sp.]